MERDFTAGIVERGHDQVFQHLALVRNEQALVDLYLLQIALAVQGQLNHSRSGGAGHLDGLELGLHLGHLGLHLLSLLHQLADVLHAPSSPVSASSPGSSGDVSSPSGSAAENRSRTAAIVAPGNVSSTA